MSYKIWSIIQLVTRRILMLAAVGLTFFLNVSTTTGQIFEPSLALAQTADEVTAPVPAQAVSDGKKTYTSYCARCHGLNMVSSSAGFFDLRQFPPDQKDRFILSVSKGIRAMPAWEDTLKPEELENLWRYVLSNSKVK
jgi:mono/diheme cytochrome c family protein